MCCCATQIQDPTFLGLFHVRLEHHSKQNYRHLITLDLLKGRHWYVLIEYLDQRISELDERIYYHAMALNMKKSEGSNNLREERNKAVTKLGWSFYEGLLEAGVGLSRCC